MSGGLVLMVAMLLSACGSAPATVLSLLDRARNAEVIGDYKTCNDDTTDALAQDASSGDALAIRAECEVLANDVMDAVTDADRALGLTHGAGVSAILARGFVAMRIGQEADGAEILMPLIRDASLDADEAVCVRALTEMVDAGQYDAAITAGHILDARFPASWRIAEQEGRAYTGAGRSDDALDAFATALDETASPLYEAEIYSLRARLYALQRDLPAALDDMNRVLDGDRVDYSYFEQRALVEDGIARYQASSSDLATAIRLAKVRPFLPADIIGRLYYERGLSFVHAGQANQAVPDLRSALGYLDGDPSTKSQVTTLLSLTVAG